jgi:uncharacterized membrane protein
LFFVLLVFALPATSFATRKEHRKKIAIVLALCIIPAMLWSLHVRNIDIMLPVLPDHPPINAAAQLRAIITQPYHYAYAVWNTYLTGRADITVGTFIAQFGRIYDLHLPLAITVAAYGLLGTALIADEKAASSPKGLRRLRVVAAVTLLVTFAGLTTILYLTYNTLKHHFVDGIQARYFLPLMILLIPILKLRKSELVRIQAKPILYLAGSTSLLVISTFMMVHRFYYALF